MQNINGIYNEFIGFYDDANKMLSDSDSLLNGDTGYSIEMHYAIVEQCYMKIFRYWENFLEQSFICYLCGNTDLKGHTYNKYATPTDEHHAYDLLKGMKQYPDWTDIYNVNVLSKLYFENAGAFSLLSNNPIEFIHIKTIRNKISHISKKSTEQFNRLTQEQVSRGGLEAGEFLLLLKDSRTTYYSFYIDTIKSYVEAICNV